MVSAQPRVVSMQSRVVSQGPRVVSQQLDTPEKGGTTLMMIKITPWQHQSPERDLKGRHGTSQRARHPSSTP
jgi:hypothetical protein